MPPKQILSTLTLAAAAMLLPAAAHAQTKPVAIDSESWITNYDYPRSSLFAGEKGIVSFRLDVDAAGKVSRCTITESSGYPTLDKHSCALLLKRSRFKPATDASGAKVPGEWASRFHWWSADVP